MERYTLTVEGRQFVIGVEEAGTDRFRVHVDGRQLEVHLEPAADAGHDPERHAVTAPLAVPPAAPHAAGVPASTAAAPGEGSLVLAPMPGTILKVFAAAGEQVARGHVLVHLEAMKMTNAVRAPQDGTVVEVLVHDGQQVVYGAPLVRLARG